MSKTNTGLVAYAKAQLGKPYWYGCFGQLSTKALYTSKKKQYPTQYQWACPDNQLNVKVHDCVGLIKGYLWCDSATDNTPTYNGSQDVSANGMLDKCKEKGAIGSMPDIPGVLVFLPGHVGVYIGNGEVVEAKGHAYGVVKTKLKGRGWKNWGKCPWITYENTVSNPTTTPAKSVETASSKPATVSKPSTSAPTYTVGKVYKTQVNELNVRVGAGTGYARKIYSALTVNAQAHTDKNGRLKKGTAVTVLEVKKVGSDIWVRIPSGWIAAYFGGKVFVK